MALEENKIKKTHPQTFYTLCIASLHLAFQPFLRLLRIVLCGKKAGEQLEASQDAKPKKAAKKAAAPNKNKKNKRPKKGSK